MTRINGVLDPSRGLFAVYSGPESEEVEDNPLDHLDKTFFNTLLDYIGYTIVRKTYTIPSLPGSGFRTDRIDLGAHGKAFTPICEVILRDWPNGDGTLVDRSITGGELLDLYGQRPGDSGILDYEGNTVDRWSRSGPVFRRTTYYDDSWTQKSLLVGAGADGDNLFLWYEQCVVENDNDGANYPAITLTLDFLVGERAVDGITGDAAPDDVIAGTETSIVMTTQRLTVNGPVSGRYDSANTYLHMDDVDPLISTPITNAVDFSNGGTWPNIYSRDAVIFDEKWAYDIKSVTGTPAIPGLTMPTLVGQSI